jgi:hypothetical protein
MPCVAHFSQEKKGKKVDPPTLVPVQCQSSPAQLSLMEEDLISGATSFCWSSFSQGGQGSHWAVPAVAGNGTLRGQESLEPGQWQGRGRENHVVLTSCQGSQAKV